MIYVLVTVEVVVDVVVVTAASARVPVIVTEVGVSWPPAVWPVQTTACVPVLGTKNKAAPVVRLNDPPPTGRFTSVNVKGAPQLPLPSPRLLESAVPAMNEPEPKSSASAFEAEYRFASSGENGAEGAPRYTFAVTDVMSMSGPE